MTRAADGLRARRRIRSAAFGPDHPLVAARPDAQLGAAQRRSGNRAAARSSLAPRARHSSEAEACRRIPNGRRRCWKQALLDRERRTPRRSAEGGVSDAERLTREHFRVSSLGLSEREALTQARSRVGGLDLAWAWASELAVSRRARRRVGVGHSRRGRFAHGRSCWTRSRPVSASSALHQDDETTANGSRRSAAPSDDSRTSLMEEPPSVLVGLSGLLRRPKRRRIARSEPWRRRAGSIARSAGGETRAWTTSGSALPPGRRSFLLRIPLDGTPTGVGAAYAASVVAPGSATAAHRASRDGGGDRRTPSAR